MTTPLAQTKDASVFGGKAVQLGASLRAGQPVPPGFALSVDEVDAIALGDVSAFDAALSGLMALQAVAVRSSAVGEDGAHASFAGQHDTVLDVRNDESLKQAVCQVRASGQTASAASYRNRLGLLDAPRMAIVVQQLVASDMAGVMFTCNPMDGHDERVIEAAWGLGEIVVAGLVTPDRYRVARSGKILERSAGEKDIAIRSQPAGGTAECAVAPELVSALCLNDDHLMALNALARQCEQHHGPGPHDIEFAFAGGQLFLLQ
ncbi:PEP/pyruvate-binding domain-containing protein [Rhodoferax sp. PAMC 29310]|uniref:PEP/pyruvate-binding domain-containing protein n=1 Tax=Rhodoferax sp. PAMC 29310 TaxID=2822760 RepID=UPI001B31D254|nr:PEP/pyruvate-binding domain-containing protein [Rhodoferax sp. PAMC 29310]